MARRPRSRTARAFPKTLTGILASLALAVLAALGIKTDWFRGKPLETARVERTPAAASTVPVGNRPPAPPARLPVRRRRSTIRFTSITASRFTAAVPTAPTGKSIWRAAA